MKKSFLFTVSVLIGVMVGAGIFGLPYVVSKSGVILGLFYFLILGIVVTLVHLFFGEIILRTKGQNRLVGLCERYLGNKSKILIRISVVLGVVGSLLAYIILAGDFLKILLPSGINLSSFQLALIFWLVSSYFVLRGIKSIAPVEVFTNLLFFFVIFLIFAFCLPKFDVSNFTLFNPSDIFLPYGVILFSLVGWSAIPEIAGILKTPEEKKNLKRAIIFSSLVVVAIYLLFSFSVISVSGFKTSSDAFSGLVPFLGNKIIFFGVLASVITLADSFLVLGLYLKNTFVYDFKFSEGLAGFIACSAPLFLFLLGFRSFIETIGFVGTIVGVIEGIIIILIFKKAKTMGDREPEYSLKIPSFLLYFLIAIFILGAVIQIL